MPRNNSEEELHINVDELKGYLRGSVYAAFVKTAQKRKEEIMYDMSLPESTQDLGKVRFLQGELNGIAFWEGFAQTMLKIAEIERSEDV